MRSETKAIKTNSVILWTLTSFSTRTPQSRQKDPRTWRMWSAPVSAPKALKPTRRASSGLKRNIPVFLSNTLPPSRLDAYHSVRRSRGEPRSLCNAEGWSTTPLCVFIVAPSVLIWLDPTRLIRTSLVQERDWQFKIFIMERGGCCRGGRRWKDGIKLDAVN